MYGKRENRKIGKKRMSPERDKSKSWSKSKGTQLRGISQSEQDVVVLQEIKPKVCFLILQGLYTYKGSALKLPLNLVLYIKP